MHAGEVIVSEPPLRTRSAIGLDWPGRGESLTDRDAEILALITQGNGNAEVAGLAFLSPNTLRSYIRTIYRKIGVAAVPRPCCGASVTGSRLTGTASSTGTGPESHPRSTSAPGASPSIWRKEKSISMAPEARGG